MTKAKRDRSTPVERENIPITEADDPCTQNCGHPMSQHVEQDGRQCSRCACCVQDATAATGAKRG